MPFLDPRDRVQRFVLRARKIMAHSLVRENFDLLNDLASGTLNATIEVNTKTGETTSKIEMNAPSRGGIRIVRRQATTVHGW
jgi:hypothetical protein